MSATKIKRDASEIRKDVLKLQLECSVVFGHDPNLQNMKEIGESWYRYGSSQHMKYARFLNTVCICSNCGYSTIAHRIDNDRTGEIGKWEEGQDGRSLH